MNRLKQILAQRDKAACAVAAAREADLRRDNRGQVKVALPCLVL